MSRTELLEYMKTAIDEARNSLREGNNGFGAVIVKDGRIVSSTHDLEETENDPTSHAEMNAIKEACRKLGKSLSGCLLVSTHEPCPMCAAAIAWSDITEIAYGYSIREAIAEGRKRIELFCKEIFSKAGVHIEIHDGILNDKCSILYRSDVRTEIKKLRNVDDQILNELNRDSISRRVKWFEQNRDELSSLGNDPLNSGYRLLLKRFNITEDEAPIVLKTDNKIVFHSRNFCPTLEACKILGLDTRKICKRLNENATDTLIKQIDPRLNFTRNYEKLRPYTDYCEEMIRMDK